MNFVQGKSDYHVHASNLRSILRFFENTSEESEQLRECGNSLPESVIAIANHHYLIPPMMLSNLASNYQIKVVPAFGILTKEGVELLVHNPTKSTKEFLHELGTQKSWWVLNICYNLMEAGVAIHQGSMLARCNKKPYEIELTDIAEEICLPAYYNPECDNPTMAWNNWIHPIKQKFPMPKPSLNDAVDAVRQEESFIYMCDDTFSIPDIKKHLKNMHVTGFTCKEENQKRMKSALEDMSIGDNIPKYCRFGSGTWL